MSSMDNYKFLFCIQYKIYKDMAIQESHYCCEGAVHCAGHHEGILGTIYGPSFKFMLASPVDQRVKNKSVFAIMNTRRY